jgi:glyoxylate carboligase
MKEKESNTPMRVTGSEAVVLSLINEGTDVMFGYPGGAIMPVYDALYKYQDSLSISWCATNRVPRMPHRVMQEYPAK